LNIYLIRHGETDWNRERRIQGQTDIPLNALGIRQAEALAQRLKVIAFDVIYCSDLGRVMQTSQIVAAAQRRDVPIVQAPELRECDYGLWEGLTRDEIAERFPRDWNTFIANGAVGKPTGGEDYVNLLHRAGMLLNRIHENEKTVLISTHLGPVRAVICRVLGWPPSSLGSFRVANGSLSVLERPPGGMTQLILLNDTCHLDGVA
jgi:broad specificity phosphatase PhoE